MSAIIFGTLTLMSAAVATFVGDIRRSILAFWLSGVFGAGLFLSVGAEVVAVIEAIVVTLAAISAVFYAITFGEYGRADARPMGKRVIAAILPTLIGTSFTGVIWIGTRHLVPVGASATVTLSIGQMGKTLVGEHLLSLEILALTLLLTVVGAGVVARSEAPLEEES